MCSSLSFLPLFPSLSPFLLFGCCYSDSKKHYCFFFFPKVSYHIISVFVCDENVHKNIDSTSLWITIMWNSSAIGEIQETRGELSRYIMYFCLFHLQCLVVRYLSMYRDAWHCLWHKAKQRSINNATKNVRFHKIISIFICIFIRCRCYRPLFFICSVEFDRYSYLRTFLLIVCQVVAVILCYYTKCCYTCSLFYFVKISISSIFVPPTFDILTRRFDGETHVRCLCISLVEGAEAIKCTYTYFQLGIGENCQSISINGITSIGKRNSLSNTVGHSMDWWLKQKQEWKYQ